ncbi:MAG TPA: hypothetical protein VFU97_21225 [Xanthobacteraceae bacterium]|nr:hypothetical protein [Xanthobacteraceae bacterium]
MPRSAVVLLSSTLIATTVFGGGFAAYSAPSELSCGEAASPFGGEVQPGAQISLGDIQAATAEQEDRAYLLETAHPGGTMVMQGAETAIARLNPEFAARLADAIRDARQSGLPSAGIFSAYRPPGFGIGGFGDKFKSLHAYGLAVDMSGIGDPGSQDAKLWHEIAAKHGVICPYGFASRTEWNHCQATQVEKVVPDNPLRKTITAHGPVVLEEMFKAGNALIHDLAAAISVAVAVNNQKGSIFQEAAASPSDADRHPVHRERSRLSEALARPRGGRGVKAKTIVLAKNEARLTERSHAKRVDEAKAHGSRKAGPIAGASHRDTARRRSHVV